MADAAAMRAALRHGRADMAAAQISPMPRGCGIGLRPPTAMPGSAAARGAGPRQAHAARCRRPAPARRSWCVADSPQLDAAAHAAANGDAGSDLERGPAEGRPARAASSDGKADYAIMDANEFEFAQHLYPDASVAFTLPDSRPLQWIVRAGRERPGTGGESVSSPARKARASWPHRAAVERGVAANSTTRMPDRFQADIVARLPELQAMFEQAAGRTGIDWRLLAAVGYQESKWQTQAASADGARGIMMLTTDAATTVGRHGSRRQRQNILGGATLSGTGHRHHSAAHRRARPYLAGAGGLQRRLRTPRRCAGAGADAWQESGFVG